MKALSIWQPWASAIATGAKTIETRSWATKHRGPLLIHAVKRKLGDTMEMSAVLHDTPWKEIIAETGFTGRNYCWYSRLAFVALIAVAELVDCLPIIDWGRGLAALQINEEYSKVINAQEQSLGNYEPGRYGWLLGNVRALPEPIPYRGRQGLFNVPDDLLPAEFLKAGAAQA